MLLILENADVRGVMQLAKMTRDKNEQTYKMQKIRKI